MGKGGKDNKRSSSNARKGILKMLSKGVKAEKPLAEEPEFLKDIDLGIHSQDVEPELRLWLSDGRVIKNIEELYNAVKAMKPKVYNEHINKGKNEFAEWVGEVLRQDALANELQKAENREESAKILRMFVEKSKAFHLIAPAEKLLEEKELPAPKNLEEALMPIEEVEHASSSRETADIKDEEMALIAEESALSGEEENLNQRRLELSKRRYALIKKRGEFERRKFQHFLSNYNGKAVQIQETRPAEKPILHGSAAKEQLNLMINQARDMAKSGRINEAMGVYNHIKASMSKSLLTNVERKKVEYDLLGLEAEIKLAAL